MKWYGGSGKTVKRIGKTTDGNTDYIDVFAGQDRRSLWGYGDWPKVTYPLY